MRASFRDVLLVAIIIIVLVPVGVVATVSYMNGEATVRRLSTFVLRQTSDRIREEVGGLLERAALISRVNRNRYSGRTFKYEDFDQITSDFYKSMGVLDELSYLSLSLPTGDYCHVERHPRSNELAITLRKFDNGRSTHRDFKVVDGKRAERPYRPDTVDGYDPRVRPFYKLVEGRTEPAWTDVYAFYNSPDPDYPGISHCTPVHDGDGNLAGVLTTDFNMIELGNFLDRLQIFDEGFAFIVEFSRESGRRVIAHPNSNLLLKRVKTIVEGKERFISKIRSIDDVRSRPVRSFMEQVPPDFDPRTAPPLTRVSFGVGDVPYEGAYAPLVNRQGVRWLIGIVVKRQQLMQQVEDNRRQSLVIGGVALLLAIGVGFYLARRVSQPLVRLVEETREIARMNLDATGRPRSKLEEIAQLNNAVDEMKAGLRSFRKYVPAELVREVLASGVEAKLGGNVAVLTVYFSDIAGFTPIAERLPPGELVALLGEYLEEMSEGIVQTGGTVDKYIGDAVMAFWGAPHPNPDHAKSACAAALDNQARLERLRARWRAAGKPELHNRIGISTGELVVGNMGCESRLNYTVIGDTVNLASRLESLNKFYETSILISATTHELVEDRFLARPLERVSVKGKAKGSIVYELLARHDEAHDAVRRLAALTAEGLDLYHAREFSQALRAYEEAARIDPGDRCAALMIESCTAYIATPPPDDWSGIRRMDAK